MKFSHTPLPDVRYTANGIGASIFGDTLGTTGNIDDFRIYDRPLTAEEIAAIYAGDLSSSELITTTSEPTTSTTTPEPTTTTPEPATSKSLTATTAKENLLAWYRFDTVPADGAILKNYGNGGDSYDATLHFASNGIQQIEGNHASHAYFWPADSAHGNWLEISNVAQDLDDTGYTVSFFMTDHDITDRDSTFLVGKLKDGNSISDLSIQIAPPYFSDVYHNNQGSSSVSLSTTGTVVVNGQSTFMTFVRQNVNSNTMKLQIWIDAILIVENNFNKVDFTHADSADTISMLGFNFDDTWAFKNKVLEDFRIYDRALTAEEIAAIYAGDLSTFELITTTPKPIPVIQGAVPVVKTSLGLPYTVADFDETKQLGLREAVATTAGTDTSLVRIVSISEGLSVSRRRALLTSGAGIVVDIEIDIPAGTAASTLVNAITVEKLNEELSNQGLESAQMLQAPVMEYVAPEPTICTDSIPNSVSSYGAKVTMIQAGTYFSDRSNYLFDQNVPDELIGSDFYQYAVNDWSGFTISIHTYPTQVSILYVVGQAGDAAGLSVFSDAGFTLIRPEPATYVNLNMEIHYYRKMITTPTTFTVPTSSSRRYMSVALKACPLPKTTTPIFITTTPAVLPQYVANNMHCNSSCPAGYEPITTSAECQAAQASGLLDANEGFTSKDWDDGPSCMISQKYNQVYWIPEDDSVSRPMGGNLLRSCGGCYQPCQVTASDEWNPSLGVTDDRIIDGLEDTYWTSGYNQWPNTWIYIDLQRQHNVVRGVVKGRYAARLSNMKAVLFSGETPPNSKSDFDTNGIVCHTFGTESISNIAFDCAVPSTVRFVGFSQAGSDTYMEFTEVAFYSDTEPIQASSCTTQTLQNIASIRQILNNHGLQPAEFYPLIDDANPVILTDGSHDFISVSAELTPNGYHFDSASDVMKVNGNLFDNTKPTANSGFSFFAWVKSSSTHSSWAYTLFSCMPIDNSNTEGRMSFVWHRTLEKFYLYTHKGTSFGQSWTNALSGAADSTAQNLIDGNWHFVGITKNAGRTDIKFYLDDHSFRELHETMESVSHTSLPHEFASDYASSGSCAIASYPAEPALYWPGFVRNVFIFDYELSAAEVGKVREVNFVQEDVCTDALSKIKCKCDTQDDASDDSIYEVCKRESEHKATSEPTTTPEPLQTTTLDPPYQQCTHSTPEGQVLGDGQCDSFMPHFLDQETSGAPDSHIADTHLEYCIEEATSSDPTYSGYALYCCWCGGGTRDSRCTDDASWQDSRNWGCWAYETRLQLCDTADDFANSDGISAKSACCACGGGSIVELPTTSTQTTPEPTTTPEPIVCVPSGLPDETNLARACGIHYNSPCATDSSPVLGEVFANTKLVDGDYGQTAIGDLQANSWMEVNLENMLYIENILVVNRQDCCQSRLHGAELYVSNVKAIDAATIEANGIYIHTFGSECDDRCILPTKNMGQYVQIIKTNEQDYLQVAQIEVYGVQECDTTPTTPVPSDALGHLRHWLQFEDANNLNYDSVTESNIGVTNGNANQIKQSAGAVGYAVEFAKDGSNWGTSNIILSTTDFNFRDEEWTLAFFAKMTGAGEPSGSGSYWGFLISLFPGTSDFWGLSHYHGQNKVRLKTRNLDCVDAEGNAYVNIFDIPLQEYHYYAVTFNCQRNGGVCDTSLSTFKMYFDGSLAAVCSITRDFVSETRTDLLYIGSAGYTNVYDGEGLIDDLRIYDQALTDEEIQSLFTTIMLDASIVINEHVRFPLPTPPPAHVTTTPEPTPELTTTPTPSLYVTLPIDSTNLVAHWKFDSGEELVDSVGNYHLTNAGPVTFPSSGAYVDQSAYFPNSGSTSFLSIGGNLDPHAIWNGNGITFSLWYKIDFDGSDKAGRLLEMGNTNNHLIWIAAKHNDNFLQVYAKGGHTNRNGPTKNIGTGTLDNTWHHMTWSVDASGNWAAFVDGVNQNIDATWDIPQITGGYTTLRFGKSIYKSDNTQDLKGSLDDIRIYNTVLTVDFIAAIFAGPIVEGVVNNPEHVVNIPITTPYPQTNGLIHWLRFQDSSRLSYDTITETELNGAQIANLPTPVQGGVHFDGTNRLTLDSISLKDMSFTVAMWVSYDSVGDWDVFLSQGASSRNKDQAVALGSHSSTTYHFGTVGNDINSAQTSESVDQFVHFAFTFDHRDDGNTRKIYRNGIKIAEQTFNAKLNLYDADSVELGYWARGNRYFDGTMRDVRIYNIVLDADEILQLATIPEPTTSTNGLTSEDCVIEPTAKEQCPNLARSCGPPDNPCGTACTVTASSTYITTTPVENAVDGTSGSNSFHDYWMSPSNSPSDTFFLLDLGHEMKIARVWMEGRVDGVPERSVGNKIYVRNSSYTDSSTTPVDDATEFCSELTADYLQLGDTSSPHNCNCNFLPMDCLQMRTGRYILVHFANGNFGMGISELEVYGAPACVQTNPMASALTGVTGWHHVKHLKKEATDWYPENTQEGRTFFQVADEIFDVHGSFTKPFPDSFDQLLFVKSDGEGNVEKFVWCHKSTFETILAYHNWALYTSISTQLGSGAQFYGYASAPDAYYANRAPFITATTANTDWTGDILYEEFHTSYADDGTTVLNDDGDNGNPWTAKPVGFQYDVFARLSTPLITTPKLWLKFDNNFLDSSPIGNLMTSSNTFSYIDGKIDKAISVSSDAELVLNTPSNVIAAGQTKLSISFWINNLSKDHNSHTILRYRPKLLQIRYNYLGNKLLQIELAGGNFDYRMDDGITTWTHVVFIADGDDWKLYLNGVNVHEETVTSTFDDGFLHSNAGTFAFFKNSGYTDYARCDLDDFRIYDIVLTADQILQLAQV